MARDAPLTELSEGELVQRFRHTGRNRYFDELYRRSRRMVYGVALRLVRQPARAEELCHDAFVRAFEGFGGLRGDAFLAWVCRIARNLSLNELRHRSVVARAAEEPGPTPVPAASEGAMAQRQALQIAARLIRKLEPDQQRVFLLRHVEGHTYEEICQLTGLTWDRVRTLLQTARRNFRAAWESRTETAASLPMENRDE